MTQTPEPTPAERFRALKVEVDNLNRAYHSGGDVSYTELLTKAQQAADLANAEAIRIAKQFRRRPKLITAAGLLR